MGSAVGRRRVLADGALAVVATFGFMVFSRGARSQGANPAAAVSVIGSFYAKLLDVMKRAKELGRKGRYDTLAPAVDATFDFPAMTQMAVGSAWAGIPAETQAALIAAFKRMTTATYAKNFDDYNGERFDVDPNPQARNGLQIVHTTLVQPNKEPVAMDYPMHPVGGDWKAVDVYYSGAVSQLAQRRSEFSAILKARGADGLLQRLNELGDQLLKGS